MIIIVVETLCLFLFVLGDVTESNNGLFTCTCLCYSAEFTAI